MNIKPLGNRVLVITNDKEVVSESGIVLPQLQNVKTFQGAVISVGSTFQGTVISVGSTVSQIKEKDTVLFLRNVGVEVTQNTYLLREDDILGTLDSKYSNIC